MVPAVASFMIYAAAVLTLQQHRDNFFYCERVGLAAAVSYTIYRAPLGKVYQPVQARLLDYQVPAEPVLDEATQLGSPSGTPLAAINDGNGMGFILVASWAMRLFGPHLYCLPYFMLGLMAISAATFLWRFADDRSAVVTVTFSSLTLMLCTPLVWNPVIANQVPIGGIRYFSLLAIVPAFHLVLELTDREGQGRRTRSLRVLLLAVQVVLLTLAVLVRGSAACIAVAILFASLVKVWKNRSNGAELRSLISKIAAITAVGAVFVGWLLVMLPFDYSRDGRVTTVFWHRAVLGLGINPAWPFGNLREIYDCTRDHPEGLVAGHADQNGYCVWSSYFVMHNIPRDMTITELYGSQYEAVMRAAFFNIVRLYPEDALATFLYYKPKLIVQTIQQDLVLDLMNYKPVVKILLLAGFLNFFVFLIFPANVSAAAAAPAMLCLVGLGGLFGICYLPSYLIAWASPATTADLLFYCLFCIGVVLSAAIGLMRAVVNRPSTPLVST